MDSIQQKENIFTLDIALISILLLGILVFFKISITPTLIIGLVINALVFLLVIHLVESNSREHAWKQTYIPFILLCLQIVSILVISNIYPQSEQELYFSLIISSSTVYTLYHIVDTIFS